MVFGSKAGLQLERFRVARFKYALFLQERTAGKESEPNDSMRGNQIGEGAVDILAISGPTKVPFPGQN